MAARRAQAGVVAHGSVDPLPPLHGRELLGWALLPLLGGDEAAGAAAQDAASWGRVARVLRADGQAGAVLPAGAWRAVAAACAAPAAAGDALPASVLAALVEARQRRGTGLNARLEPPEAVAAAAASALHRAAARGASAAWRALASEALVALQHAAHASPNSRKTCALFVETVLPEFAAAWHALRAGPDECVELARTVEATLHAGLFVGSLVSGHLAAAASAAASAAPSTPTAADAEQPAKKRLKTSQLVEDTTAAAHSISPQAALYQLVCSRVRSGDLCFVAMLPWLTRCFGSMQRPHAAAREAASSGSKHHGFAVVQLFGTALADLMRDASKRNDLDAWVAAAEAWSAVLLDAHRHDLCRAPGRAVSVFLLSLLPELLLQQGRFPSARAAAAAGSVLRALLEVDVHLLEERLSDVWSVLMHGAALAQADCVCAARDLVIAYGETRLLPKVLVAATTALCVGRTRNTPEVGALLCAPELGAAWAAAAEKLPAMQCPELISCVRDCLAHADAAGAFAPGSMLDCVIASLAEMLSATLSGVVATPEASAALASAAVELQVFAKSLLDKLLPSKGVKLVSAGGVALCLRICTCVASLVHACAACTSDIAVPLPVPEQCDAILRDCLERLAPWLASEKRHAAPWCELEAARAALLLRTWEDRCGTTSSRAYVAHLARLPLALDAVKRGVWDGMFSTVTVETLPCAFWQLVTEHMATWCASVPVGCLEAGLAYLIRTAAASGGPMATGITAAACSRQLLSDASFYELPNVRAVLPNVLRGELRGAQERVTAAVKGGPFDAFCAQMETADLRQCIATAHALVAAEQSAARTDDSAASEAALDAFAVVRVLSWIPPAYFASLPELPELLAVLCRLEKVLIAAVLCGAAQCAALACQTVSVLRRVVSDLLASSAIPAPRWTAEVQVHWLVRSLDVLVALDAFPVSSAEPPVNEVYSETAALATGALLGQLSSAAASPSLIAPVSFVLAAVTSSCSDLRDLASCYVSDTSPTDQLSSFLPRMVQMQQRQPKSQAGTREWVPAPAGGRELATPPRTVAHTKHALAMSKALLAASVLTAVIGARPSGEWLDLQRLVADALDSLCAPAQSAQAAALCRPLFTALAATLELEAGADFEPNMSAVRVSTERVLSLLHSAAQLLGRDSVGAVELLRYLQAAVKVLVQRDELPDSVCSSLLVLYIAVMRSQVERADADASASIRAAAMDAFAALAATGVERQQDILADALVAAAQDVPAADEADAPRQWAMLSATLQLLTVLLRTLPKPACVRNAERCLAVAVLACAHAGHAAAAPLALLEQVALPAVSVLDTLLKSRSKFPLRGSSVASALSVPASLFDASSRLAAMLGQGTHATFVASCALLATAARCRPHELQRCIPLLASSSRVLAGALLRGVHAVDDSAGSPAPPSLLTCAAELGSLYAVVAGEDTVHGKYCAHMLADYVTATAAAHLDVCSHAAAAPLEDGVHALLGACSAFELQQLHVTLGAGLGGVRQTMLAQLTEQRTRVKYSGKV